jgi:hypothetical protein
MAMNPFDQASRYAAKLDPPGFLEWLLPGLSAALTFHGWLDTRTLPFPGEPDRTGDTVARLCTNTDPRLWWALALEFQSEPHHEMFGRVLEYLGRAWRECRPTDERGSRFEVGAVVINLTGTGHTSRDMVPPGQPGVRTCLQVAERNLAAEDAAATLAGRWPDACCRGYR